MTINNFSFRSMEDAEKYMAFHLKATKELRKFSIRKKLKIQEKKRINYLIATMSDPKHFNAKFC